ncbi:MAG: hypothetical protein ABIH23_17045, partial [bacterium]
AENALIGSPIQHHSTFATLGNVVSAMLPMNAFGACMQSIGEEALVRVAQAGGIGVILRLEILSTGRTDLWNIFVTFCLTQSLDGRK